MSTMEFDAVIQSDRGGGAHVSLPAEAADVFGTRARFPIRATCNGVEYRGSTMPTGEGTFFLGLTRAVRAKAGVEVGDQVHVVVVRDTEDRTIEVPGDLMAALDQADLTTTFASLTFTHRKEYVRWVLDAKRPETRQHRVAKSIKMIAAQRRSS